MSAGQNERDRAEAQDALLLEKQMLRSAFATAWSVPLWHWQARRFALGRLIRFSRIERTDQLLDAPDVRHGVHHDQRVAATQGSQMRVLR
jgi:hypothetical protein